jgi:drug/metabolite transporter (DMT)-like permease
MATPIWAIGVFVIVSMVSAVATFLLKIAAPKISRSVKKLFKNWQLLLGVALYGIATIVSLIALRAGELSVLYPFVALQYVWTNILSKKYLNEPMNLLKWGGIVLIFIGVSLIGVGA